MNKLFIALFVVIALTAFTSAAFNVNITYLNNQTYEVRSNVTNALRGTITIANQVSDSGFSECDVFSCSIRYDVLSRFNVTYNSNAEHFLRNYFIKNRQSDPDLTVTAEKLMSVQYNIAEQTRSCTDRSFENGFWVSTNCTITTRWNNFTRDEWRPWREDTNFLERGMNNFRVTYTRTNTSAYYDLFPSFMDTRNLTEFAWWNNSFTYKANITQNSLQNVVLNNFVARAFINTSGLIAAGKMNATCQDLRIVNTSEDAILDYEIEDCGTQNTTVYFRVPVMPTGNQTFYVYYGAMGASSQENWTRLWNTAGFVGAYLGKTNGSVGSAFENGSILIDSAGFNNLTRVGASTCYANKTVGRYGFGIHMSGADNCYFEKVNPRNLAGGNASSTEIFTSFFIGQGGTDFSNNAIFSYGGTATVNGARSAAFTTGSLFIFRWFASNFNGGLYPTATWQKNFQKYTNTSNLHQSYNTTGIYNTTYGAAATVLQTSRIGAIAWSDANEGALGNLDEYLISNGSISTDYIYGFQNQQSYQGIEQQIIPPVNNVTVTLTLPTNAQIMVYGTTLFVVSTTFIGSNVTNVTLIGNFGGSWADNATSTTLITVSPGSTSFNIGLAPGVYNWTARACLADGSCNYSNQNYSLTITTVAPRAPLYAPLNQTMAQELSDELGSGMLGVFGNVLIVGVFIIMLALAFMYILGFTPDVTIPVLIILVAAMASRLPGAQFPVLPPWTAFLVGIIAALIIFYGVIKVLRR